MSLKVKHVVAVYGAAPLMCGSGPVHLAGFFFSQDGSWIDGVVVTTDRHSSFAAFAPNHGSLGTAFDAIAAKWGTLGQLERVQILVPDAESLSAMERPLSFSRSATRKPCGALKQCTW